MTQTPPRKFPYIWIVALLLVLAAGAGWLQLRARDSALPPVLGTLENFTLTNQDNQPYTLRDLQGSVHVINFIFTSCPDACPLLTKQMSKLQRRAEELKIPVNFVSISVDPTTDTPEVLKDYAKKYDAHFQTWSFLTGPLDSIERVVLKGFKVALDRPADSAILDVTHSEHFVIVDQSGRIRSYRRAANSEEINQILAEVLTLNKYSSSAR